MNYDLAINPNELDLFKRSLLYRFEQARSPIQQSMAEKFFEIVRLNFGDFGVDRPVEWAPLSPAYARRVNREHATLFVSGKLESSVQVESNEERARVFITDSDVPYATAHQFGVPSKNLPPRPYFPIDGNEDVLPFTRQQVEEAARTECANLLGGGIL